MPIRVVLFLAIEWTPGCGRVEAISLASSQVSLLGCHWPNTRREQLSGLQAGSHAIDPQGKFM